MRPLPPMYLPFLDGSGVSLPWYRWFQGLATGSGSQGPPGPPGPSGPAGSDGSSLLSLLAAAALDKALEPTALDLLAAANLDLGFIAGANITLNGGSAPVYGGQITIASTGGGLTDTATVNQSGGLAAGNICFVFDNSGAANVELANATDFSRPPNCFALATFANGATATIYLPGQYVTGLSSLSPGAAYYLATTGGAISTSPPSGAGNAIWQVGVADSTGTKLFFNPQLLGQL